MASEAANKMEGGQKDTLAPQAPRGNFIKGGFEDQMALIPL